MYLILFILGSLLVLASVAILLAVKSRTPDPEDDEEFHENIITMDNVFPWRGAKKTNSN